jgi:hypothetical protein
MTLTGLKAGINKAPTVSGKPTKEFLVTLEHHGQSFKKDSGDGAKKREGEFL